MSKHQYLRFALLGLCWLSVFALSGQRNMKMWNKLIWSDEFDGNGLPDSSKWNYDLGDGCPQNCGWGNNELQYYTANDTLNARQKDGMLIIEARSTGKPDRPYTSARLVSRGKASWPSGYLEARIKLPKGKGVWPAFWMLPEEWKYGGWPASGEIDIMEFVGYTLTLSMAPYIARTSITSMARRWAKPCTYPILAMPFTCMACIGIMM